MFNVINFLSDVGLFYLDYISLENWLELEVLRSLQSNYDFYAFNRIKDSVLLSW